MTTPTIITPSPERTVTLPNSQLTTKLSLRWPVKNPGDTLDFTLDVSSWLLDVHDTVGSFTAVVNSGNPTDLTLTQAQPATSPSNVNGLLPVILSGGATGYDYSVTFTVTGETTGLTLQVTVWVLVMALSVNRQVYPGIVIGSTGPAGASLLTGAAAPTSSLGNDGDTYFQESTGYVWAKSAGAWTQISNLTGPPGSAQVPTAPLLGGIGPGTYVEVSPDPSLSVTLSSPNTATLSVTFGSSGSPTGSVAANTIGKPGGVAPLDPNTGLLPHAYLCALLASDISAAQGYVSYDTANPSGFVNTAGATAAAPVQTVFGRAGAVSLQSSDVSGALGYVPYSAANPSNYITAAGAPVQTVFGRAGAVSLQSTDVTGALGFAPYDAANPDNFINADGAPVQTVFGRTGTVVLESGDVAGALGFVPYDSANPAGYINAAGAPVQTVFGRNGAVSLLSADVTGALGFIPYSATNPSNYIAASGAPVQSVAGKTGTIVLAASDIGAGIFAAARIPLATPTVAGAVVVPNGALIGTNNGTLTPLSVGIGLQISGGILSNTGGGSGGSGITIPPAQILGGTGGNQFSEVNVSSGLSLDVSNNLTANVQTVFGRTGAVSLLNTDVTGALGYIPYDAANPGGYISSAGAPVQSVFGRTGIVAMGSVDVTNALGFVPYNATNPSGFITAAGAPVQTVFGRAGAVSLLATDVTGALGYTPYRNSNPAGYINAAGAPVQTVFGRAGAVSLLNTDVTGALGFVPYSAANPSNFITSAQAPVQTVFGRAGAVSLLNTDVTGALGFVPYNAANPSNYITAAQAPVQTVFGRAGTVSLLSADVTGALGFIPYSAANPSNFINAAGAPVQSVAGRTGSITLSASDIGAGVFATARLPLASASAAGAVVLPNGALLGSSGGALNSISIGAGLLLSGNVLSNTGAGSGSVSVPTATLLAGVSGTLQPAPYTPAFYINQGSFDVAGGVNIERFGAKNDGTTDCFSAFNTAITDGIAVILNGGTYATSSLSVSGSLIIVGQHGHSVIVPKVPAADFITIANGGTLHARDTVFDGSALTNTSRLLYGNGAAEFRLDGCAVRNNQSAPTTVKNGVGSQSVIASGIYLTGAANTFPIIDINRTHIYGNCSGITLQDIFSAKITNNWIHDNSFSTSTMVNTSNGINIQSSSTDTVPTPEQQGNARLIISNNHIWHQFNNINIHAYTDANNVPQNQNPWTYAIQIIGNQMWDANSYGGGFIAGGSVNLVGNIVTFTSCSANQGGGQGGGFALNSQYLNSSGNQVILENAASASTLLKWGFDYGYGWETNAIGDRVVGVVNAYSAGAGRNVRISKCRAQIFKLGLLHSGIDEGAPISKPFIATGLTVDDCTFELNGTGTIAGCQGITILGSAQYAKITNNKFTGINGATPSQAINYQCPLAAKHGNSWNNQSRKLVSSGWVPGDDPSVVTAGSTLTFSGWSSSNGVNLNALANPTVYSKSGNTIQVQVPTNPGTITAGTVNGVAILGTPTWSRYDNTGAYGGGGGVDHGPVGGLMTFTTVSSLSGVTAGGNLPAAGVQLHAEDVFDGVYIRDPVTSTGLPTGYCQWNYGLPGGPGKVTDVTPFLPGGSPGSGYTALNISLPGSSDVLNEYIATDAFTAFYYMTPNGISVPAGGFIGARAQNPTTVFSSPPTPTVAGTGGTGCVPIAILGVPVPSDSRMIIATGPNGSLNYGAGTISANSVQELFENGGVYVIPVSSGGGGGGATTLSSLTDVNISGLANGDGLFFSTVDNKWHNTSPTTFGAGLLGNASDGTTGNISLVNLTYTPLSTETGGVAGTLTATASGGGGSPDIFDPFLVAMKTSSWYGPPVSSGGVSTAAFAFNTLYATPIPLLAGTVIKKYGCHIVTANQFNFNIEFGLFADTGNGAPGNLVSGSYSGTVSVTAGASGDFTTILGSSFTIAQSGWYWIAVNTSATGATISCVSTGNVSPMITRLIGGTSTAQALSGPACGYAMTQASGSMPSTFSSTPTVLSVNCLAGAIGT